MKWRFDSPFNQLIAAAELIAASGRRAWRFDAPRLRWTPRLGRLANRLQIVALVLSCAFVFRFHVPFVEMAQQWAYQAPGPASNVVVNAALGCASNCRYVDNACTFNGNGLAHTCAASGGAVGAYNVLTSGVANVVAGETLYIKSGTYITTNGANENDSGFQIANSGTSGSKIVIKPYPGATVTIAGCEAVPTTYCDNAAMTMYTKSHITIDGNNGTSDHALKIVGSISYWGTAFNNRTTGITIKNIECTVGMGGSGDGNWACIRGENSDNALIQDNYVHDIDVLDAGSPGGGQQNSMGCFKLFVVISSTFEYNTCKTVDPTGNGNTNCWDEHANGRDNIYRYNYCESPGYSCFKLTGQDNGLGADSGDLVYQNICYNGNTTNGNFLALTPASNTLSSMTVYNNLFYSGYACISSPGGESGLEGLTFYNNICDGSGLNLEMYTGMDLPLVAPPWDYNRWKDLNYKWNQDGDQTTLAGFRTEISAEAASTEGSCTFVNAPTDFTLSAGTACTAGQSATGRVGGVVGGATIDLGPYVNGITCVGHTCS